MKEIFWRRWCIREDDSLTFALRAVADATLSFLVPAVNTAISSIPSLLKVTENMVHPGGFEPPTARFVAEYSIQLSYGCKMAVRRGFEPRMQLLTAYSLSRGAPSASRPPHQHASCECFEFLVKSFSSLRGAHITFWDL